MIKPTLGSHLDARNWANRLISKQEHKRRRHLLHLMTSNNEFGTPTLASF